MNNQGSFLLKFFGVFFLCVGIIFFMIGFRGFLMPFEFSDGRLNLFLATPFLFFLSFPSIILGVILLLLGFVASAKPQRPVPKQPAPAVPEVKPASGVICQKCRSENSQEAKYCKNCGAPMVTFKYCNRCNAKNAVDARYCNNCGNKFE